MELACHGQASVGNRPPDCNEPGVPAPFPARPILQHVSTSYVERRKLTLWMSMRRFSRRTDGFPEKTERVDFGKHAGVQ